MLYRKLPKYFFHHWFWGDISQNIHRHGARNIQQFAYQHEDSCRMVRSELVKKLVSPQGSLTYWGKRNSLSAASRGAGRREDTQIPAARRVAHCVEMSREVLHDNVLMKIKSNSFVWPLRFIQGAAEAQCGPAAQGIKLFLSTQNNDWRHWVTGSAFLSHARIYAFMDVLFTCQMRFRLNSLFQIPS